MDKKKVAFIRIRIGFRCSYGVKITKKMKKKMKKRGEGEGLGLDVVGRIVVVDGMDGMDGMDEDMVH